MFARQPKFVVLLLAAYVLTLSIASAQISKKSARKRAVKQEEAAPAPQPPPPPPPPTLEQMPASAPQVFFRNGQLTIVARNSTLGDILRAVHTQTGASVDVPSNARSEEHTSELQSQSNLVCRLLLEKKKHDRTQSVT